MKNPIPSACLEQAEEAASRVLAAERAAMAEVENCRQQRLRWVAVSCLRAELLRKRTEERIERWRERMTATARGRQAQIDRELAALAHDRTAEIVMLAALDRAIPPVIDELAGVPASS